MDQQIAHQIIRFQTEEEITIIADAFGNPAHDPVLLLHGGGQTRHSWKKSGFQIAKKGWYVLALDARGHGESSWSKKLNYSFDYISKDLLFVIQALDKKPVLIGASMGGFCSMLVLAKFPEIAKALILVDVSPKVEQKGIDRIFQFMGSKPEGYESLEEVRAAIANYLPHRKNTGSLKGLKKSLRKLPNGNYGWHWDPEMLKVWSSLTDHRNPNESEDFFNGVLQNLLVPCLLVRGGMSDVVSIETVKDLLKIAPNLQFIDIKDAGHMIAGDSNDIFTDALLGFLQQIK